jgi:hypothetical protein
MIVDMEVNIEISWPVAAIFAGKDACRSHLRTW